jgi:hypothetical protein
MENEFTYKATMFVLFICLNIIFIYKIENESFRMLNIILLIATVLYSIFSLF